MCKFVNFPQENFTALTTKVADLIKSAHPSTFCSHLLRFVFTTLHYPQARRIAAHTLPSTMEQETSSQSVAAYPFTPRQASSTPSSRLPPRNPRTRGSSQWSLEDIRRTTDTIAPPSPSSHPFSPSPTTESEHDDTQCPTNIPAAVYKGRFSALPPTEVVSIDTSEYVDRYIENRLLQMNKGREDPEYEKCVQKAILDLISRAHLTPEIFTKLRGL